MADALYFFFQNRYSQNLAPHKQRLTASIIDLLLFLFFLLLLTRPISEIIFHRFNLKSLTRRLDDIKFIIFEYLWLFIASVSTWKLCRSMSYFSSAWLLDFYVSFRLLVRALVINFLSLERKWWAVIKILLLDLTVKQTLHIVSFIQSDGRNQFISTSFINLCILFSA